MKKNYTKSIISFIIVTIGLVSSSSYATSGHRFYMGGSTYECPYTADGYDAFLGKCYATCFVKDTQVTMADGTKKNIQDVQVGDVLQGSHGANTVKYLIHKDHEGLIYSFNGGKYFVTDSHPFMTTEGWKSINPEATKLADPGVPVTKLEIGDILITEHGQVLLEKISSKELPQKVYTFSVDGTHDYYADGYLVHNKYDPSVGCPGATFNPYNHGIYDWTYNIGTYQMCVNDQGPATLIGAATGGVSGYDNSILNMIYWDKNQNNTYDSGDYPIKMATYAVSLNTDTDIWGVVYNTVNYNSGGAFWRNNSLDSMILQVGQYDIGISQSSSQWQTVVNQGFTTIDAITGNINITTNKLYTGIDVGLEYSCNGTGTQTVSFIEYSCGSGYTLRSSSCYKNSTAVGSACTSNADCSGSGSCIGYSGPNSTFKYNDGSTWDNTHTHWNDRPHGNAVGYCRSGDAASGCTPNSASQNPNWYGGGILCGCSNFIPNTSNTPGACSTTGSQYILPTETVVTDTITCSGTGSSCSVSTQTPTYCDVNDSAMAGVCYTPSNFGATLVINNGQVAINSGSAAYPLDINGTVRAGQILVLSDKRLKSSIEKIDNALAKISKINGYTFTWKKDGKADMGVLAQEIEQVFSHAVSTDPSGSKTVQYMSLLAPIIEAIHELNTNIDQESVKAKAQSDHITQLEKRLQSK